MIFSIIIGGALGNFYDRLIFNAVPDFIDLHYMNYHWFTFNVADIFISIGIISFLLKGFFNKKK
jgi:signal peptidase II|tara:strand:+ start:106 stop:297 length:192 start_codon:yes stop_codon:yes gene_type:complete